MLRLKPTYEEMLREAKTRRLKILPERERRTQQGMLPDDLDMDDFDLDKYDKKTILMNENPEKGTQTDRFNKTSTTESESAKSVIEDQRVKEEVEEQEESEYSRQESEASEEKEKQKSLMRRLFNSLFDEVEADFPRSLPTSHASSARGSNDARQSLASIRDARQSLASIRDPMPNKKSETPIQSSSSSSSATSRSVLLPVESAPVSVNSSRSQTIEYVDEEDLPVNVSSSSSNRTVRYISSGSSRRSRPITISSGSR